MPFAILAMAIYTETFKYLSFGTLLKTPYQSKTASAQRHVNVEAVKLLDIIHDIRRLKQRHPHYLVTKK